MSIVIGQTRLMQTLDSYNLDTLPKAMLFSGPKGCGKHFVARTLANNLGLTYKDLDAGVSAEELLDYTYSTIHTLYVADLDSLSEKQQNSLLKFIEEPSNTVFVVLTTSAPARVLSTILNRCVKHTFEDYSKEELAQILNKTIDNNMLAVFKTPGKLKMLTDKSFADTMMLAEKIALGDRPQNYGQYLVLLTKVNFKDFYDKVDFDLLLDAVEYVAFNNYRITASLRSLKAFQITSKFKQYAVQSTLIREMLMVNYLTQLWEVPDETT
jgi:DNA polymerase III gamma/tau subunit